MRRSVQQLRGSITRRFAVAVIADLGKNTFILRADGRPETSALTAQKAYAFGSTEPSAHRLRLQAI